jgi:hypothetical protein
MSSWCDDGHHFFCYAKDGTLAQSIFSRAANKQNDEGRGSGSSDHGGETVESAMMFPAGTQVEVMYSFWPTDGVFFNGDWYKGWVQGCHTSGLCVSVDPTDDESRWVHNAHARICTHLHACTHLHTCRTTSSSTYDMYSTSTHAPDPLMLRSALTCIHPCL